MTKKSLFQVGTIVGTRGLRGELKVAAYTAGADILLAARSLRLHCVDGKELIVDVAKARAHKRNIVLCLSGYDHIDSVAPLHNAKIMLAYDQLPPLADGEYYWHQLEGLQVVDSACGELGVLTAVVKSAAHDIYVVQGEDGEVMFPAVDQFIDAIDITAGQMRVTLPAGLVDLNK